MFCQDWNHVKVVICINNGNLWSAVHWETLKRKRTLIYIYFTTRRFRMINSGWSCKFLMATVAVKSLYEWQLCHLHREDEVVRWTGTLGGTDGGDRGGGGDFLVFFGVTIFILYHSYRVLTASYMLDDNINFTCFCYRSGYYGWFCD